MININELTGLAAAEHSHEEIWNLVPGLDPQLSQLAHELLPAMKRSKRLVIRIGAAGLQDEAPEVIVALAYELSAICSDSAKQVADRYESALGAGLIGEIIHNVKALGAQARAIVAFGIDGESARALRLAYRAFRNSCAVLWLYEFAPEGRPRMIRGVS